MPQPSVRCYDYVNQRYSRVRDALLANPHHVFRRATSAATAHAARLHLRIGALEIGTEIEIQIVSVEHDFAYDRPATRLILRWQAADQPRAFPSMVATLTLFALTPTETQLAVDGTYEPPLGKLGEVLDAAVGHRIAEATVTTFVQEVAGWLRDHLATRTTADLPPVPPLHLDAKN